MGSLGSAAQKVEVEIRRYEDGPDCDVVVTTRRRRLVMSCPTYDEALRWALLECKVYKLPAVIGQSLAVPRQAPEPMPGAFRAVVEFQKVG
jgi:hypothetical protein